MALSFSEAAKRYETKFTDKKLVTFIASKKPCIIYCPLHGEQESPGFQSILRSKHGCPMCGQIRTNSALHQAAQQRNQAVDTVQQVQSLLNQPISDAEFRQQVAELLG